MGDCLGLPGTMLGVGLNRNVSPGQWLSGFHSVLWPLTAGLALSGFMAYRFAPDTSSITDYIAYYFPDRKVWTERNDAYLEKVIVLSEDRRLLEDAEAPKLRRRRFPQSVWFFLCGLLSARFLLTLGS